MDSPALPGPSSSTQLAPAEPPPSTSPEETDPLEIPITGPMSEAQAEISGMAWFGESLILLPQYPSRYADTDDGAVFTISKAEILDFIQGKANAPIEPRLIPFNTDGIENRITGFEGFEALAISGEQAFLTVESRPAEMLGYLVGGLILPDLSQISLDVSRITPIPPQAGLSNMTDESLLVFGRRILTLYEANGVAVNPTPRAHLFTLDLQLMDSLAFPSIEYRITDATPPDEMGKFWAINYFFPGDQKLEPQVDPLARLYGEGLTHAQYQTVERLVQFQIGESGIVHTDQPPIQLQLIDDDHSRNWEAVARLDDLGFLLATDKYPFTLLVFVPFSEENPN